MSDEKDDFNTGYAAGERQTETITRVERECELRRLAELGPIDYDQERKKLAERLGVRAGAIDEEIKQRKQRDEESKERSIAESLFAPIEPYNDAVNGHELVIAIHRAIQRYVVLSDNEAIAAALWALHSHAVDAAHIAPILLLKSPQKRCGKSTLLDVMRSLVYRGLLANSVSTAVVYRAMDLYRCTLLIDEADAFLDDNEELRAVLNGGHSRATSKTLRIGGVNRDMVEVFDGFGPKAIAGIGKRRETIVDRSITVSLRRRKPDEKVEPLRQDRLDNRQLQSFAAAWSAAHMAELRRADPSVPESLHDRAADNWRPLLAIADLCGIGAEARKAAVALTGTDDNESAGVMLLEDIRRLFGELQTDRLSSALIVDRLGAMEERPWPEWRNGKQITQRQIAKLLDQFEIGPKKIRIVSSTAQGYLSEWFTDAFSRYLTNSRVLSGTAEQMSNDAASSGSESGTEPENVPDRSGTKPSGVPDVPDRSGTGTDDVPDRSGLQASNDAGCSGVPDKNADLVGGKRKRRFREEI